MPTDDLGSAVVRAGPARRVVSLVPSLTEALAATRREALVGATEWCTHPRDLDVARVRGTKNPDVRAIAALHPDLVVANMEENRRIDVERLRAAGVAVWVTRIEDVPGALASLGRLFTDALGWGRPAWLDEAAAAWSKPSPPRRRPVAIAVWRDPWMVVGSRTFTGDLAARLGLDNVFGDAEDRYPKLDGPAAIVQRDPDVVLLPDEPYPFSAADGPEAFPTVPSALVSGRALTWYGPSLTTARDEVLAAVAAARAPGGRRG